MKPSADEITGTEANDHHDGALEDLLALIYAEVKRRGGCVKVHHGGATRLQTDMKVYDYLWVGEGVRNADLFRETIKNHPPYVVPCLDMSRATIESEDELYLESIPYMQFPLLLAGRPFTGERAMIPGIQYRPGRSRFLDQPLPRNLEVLPGAPAGPLQLRLVGFGSRPARGAEHPRALAERDTTPGGRGNMGLAGNS